MFFFKKRPKVVPATELLSNFDGYRLRRGESYLVKEPKPELSFEIFMNMVKGVCIECSRTEAFPCENIVCMECTLSCPCKPCKYARAQGLCFTMDQPEGVRQRFLLQTTPIFWISKHGKGSINPVNLEIMAGMINNFFRTSKNPVVLLDGIEYLIITNGFIPVLKFLHDLREWVIIHNAVLILPLNPATLDEKEFALIERNMQSLDFSSKVSENYYITQR